ncbi:kelch-like protein 12 [Acropora muricata]|uniref:kelch-like protein 12 n=1 Tax=Acropora muricata TaxID=159855 RepID=UPI0034E3B0E5
MVAHSEILLSKCAHFREQGEFIDVRLKVGEYEFAAHRVVLAANSDYFHAMLARGMKESYQEVIELKDENISAAAMKKLIDFMYSGEISVNNENVFEVLIAADHLQVTSVVQQCCKYFATELVELGFDVQFYCRVIMFADRRGLKELKEAMESKMASVYEEICEKQEFLSHMNADLLSALLCRDDLRAPSEKFVLKSVTQWINYKKEERMDVAAQVIGGVRLGLVHIKDVIDELDTEEMQVIPEMKTLLHEAFMYNHRPSRSSVFALAKGKPRSTSMVLVAIVPEGLMWCFDVQSKKWKLLTSMQKLAEEGERMVKPDSAGECYCAEVIGNYLYVAATGSRIHCYDIVHDIWRTLPPCPSYTQIGSLCHFEDHLYAICKSSAPYRYNIARNQWQCVASSKAVCNLSQETFCNKAAVVYKSCIYVLYGQAQQEGNRYGGTFYPEVSVLYCFDPKENVWEKKASTKTPHFGSSLLVVNNKLCVAGGTGSHKLDREFDLSAGDPAAVEVYNDQKNAWSVVKQKRIPPNNLGAVEIDGRVYFIINSFPLDSGIRIPPGEVYPVVLEGWEDLPRVKRNAILCYVPLKTENLKTEEMNMHIWRKMMCE